MSHRPTSTRWAIHSMLRVCALAVAAGYGIRYKLGLYQGHQDKGSVVVQLRRQGEGATFARSGR